ncbi:MAG: hypothetical protein ACM3RP_00010 [Chitinophagales bacterium]
MNEALKGMSTLETRKFSIIIYDSPEFQVTATRDDRGQLSYETDIPLSEEQEKKLMGLLKREFDADSGPNRTPVPINPEHLFRLEAEH